MLLYQGSQYVRGNRFKDKKGNILTFEKNTKDGKLFVTSSGSKLGLTEGQVAKLELLETKFTEDESKDVKNALWDNLNSMRPLVKDILDSATSKEELDDFVETIKSSLDWLVKQQYKESSKKFE